MSILSEIIAVINRLNQELDEIERQAIAAQNLVREALSRLPENAMLIQTLDYLNEMRQFVNDSRNAIASDIESISGSDVTNLEIQQVGEDLAASLGMTLEIKMQVQRLLSRLEELL
jgi:vacuolar-type H+-ATPase subunit D/Vma8